MACRNQLTRTNNEVHKALHLRLSDDLSVGESSMFPWRKFFTKFRENKTEGVSMY
jgi:hypothetical protein